MTPQQYRQRTRARLAAKGIYMAEEAPVMVAQQDPKSILESKTFWGLLIGLAIPALSKHGIIVDPTGLATDVSTLIGGVLAIYGRFTASAPLTMRK